MSDQTSGGQPKKPGSNPPPSTVAPPTAVHHLAVKVRDLDRAEACVVQLGGRVQQRSRTADGCDVVECLDPQGACFALTVRKP